MKWFANSEDFVVSEVQKALFALFSALNPYLESSPAQSQSDGARKGVQSPRYSQS